MNKKNENIMGYIFLGPWLIGFFVFTLFPLLYTFYLSFNDVKLTVSGWETTWIAIENYISALMSNILFRSAMLQFLILEIVYVPAIVIISFILAILLNQKIKFRVVFRIIYFLPVIVLSGSVMFQLMDSGNSNMVDITNNLIYKMIDNYSHFIALGIEFLFRNFSLILWFTGIPIILFINGLQKINRYLYEAARIDGASSWQILWKITVPIIKPIAQVITIFTIVQLGLFPLNPAYDLIKQAIYNNSSGLGVASAYAWIYSMVILLIILVSTALLRDNETKQNKRIVKYRTQRTKLTKRLL